MRKMSPDFCLQMGLMVNPLKRGDISFDQFVRERYTYLNFLSVQVNTVAPLLYENELVECFSNILVVNTWCHQTER